MRGNLEHSGKGERSWVLVARGFNPSEYFRAVDRIAAFAKVEREWPDSNERDILFTGLVREPKLDRVKGAQPSPAEWYLAGYGSACEHCGAEIHPDNGDGVVVSSTAFCEGCFSEHAAEMTW